MHKQDLSHLRQVTDLLTTGTKSAQVFRENVSVGSGRVYGFHFRLTVFIDAARDLEAFVVVPEVEGLTRCFMVSLVVGSSYY